MECPIDRKKFAPADIRRVYNNPGIHSTGPVGSEQNSDDLVESLMRRVTELEIQNQRLVTESVPVVLGTSQTKIG